ncbi:tyrosine-type recombinase/integrase, partial [Shigella sonnei]|uniref:tyrosine-type recombinase/integrase n=1 Tax=Shigella sonnei TaxID=624 RepID=UPI0020920F74
GYPQTNRKIDTGKTLTRWPVFVDHFMESGHGFRHEFSTIMNEHEWPADAIEVQLAHANGGSVRGIYNHAQYLDKRREMMQWWADWLDEKVE